MVEASIEADYIARTIKPNYDEMPDYLNESTRGGNSGGSTGAYQTQSYTPESHRLDYGQGAGGTNPNGSGGCGGGGWFFGHNGGAGGNNGKNGSAGGIGAGGGAGAWAVFAGGSGARGGNGYAALFY